MASTRPPPCRGPSGVHSWRGGARPRCARCGAVVRTRSGAVAGAGAVGAGAAVRWVRTGAVVRCAAHSWWCAPVRTVRPGAVRGPVATEARPEPVPFITRPLDRDLSGVPNARYAGPRCATYHIQRGWGLVRGCPPPTGRTEVRRAEFTGARTGALRGHSPPPHGAHHWDRCAHRMPRCPAPPTGRVRRSGVHPTSRWSPLPPGALHGGLHSLGWSLTVGSTPLAPDRPPCPPSRRWGPPRPLTDGHLVSGWGPLPCPDPAASGAAAGGRGRPRPWPAASVELRPR